MSIATAPTVIASRILDAAGRRGLDSAILCNDIGIDERSLRSSTKVPLEKLFSLWEVAKERICDPGFPVEVSELQQIETYGMLALLGMTCSNLGAALRRIIRFYPLWTSSSRWELRTAEPAVVLEFVQPGNLRPGQYCDHEFSLAEMTKAIRVLCGSPDWSPSEVRFRHPPHTSLARHEAFFRAPLGFSSARTELVLQPRDLEMPMIRANEILADFFEQHSERLMHHVGTASDAVRRIRSAIVEELRLGVPRLPRVAARLNLGARSLRRVLETEGTTFKALLDDARQQLARQYVEDSNVPIGEIIHMLGFSEPSAFYRAFKRWTGDAPARYRDKARRGA